MLVCGGTGCTSSGSAEAVSSASKSCWPKRAWTRKSSWYSTGCFGLCAAGPVVIVYPEGAFYSRIKVEDVDEIVAEHLLKGRIVPAPAV